MSVNKILSIPQWQTVASASAPESGFSAIYPESGSGKWIVVDDQGYAKDLGFALDNLAGLNGITYTQLGASNPFGYQLDVAIAEGLTFSYVGPGSAIRVSGLTSGSLDSSNSPTSGYILGVTAGGQFEWLQYTAPGVSGTLNYVSKFTSANTISDSQIYDDGSIVSIGPSPSVVSVIFNVSGDSNFGGKLYFDDSSLAYIDYSTGFEVQTEDKFVILRGTYEYSKFDFDLLNTYTYSLMNGALFISDDSTNKLMNINVMTFSVGNTSSQTEIYFKSSAGSVLEINSGTNNGALKIVDGTEGTDKLFVSDSTGLGSWQSIWGSSGVQVTGLTISANISGYGLTLSGNSLVLDYGIFGSTLTYSSGVVNLPSVVTAGTYGSSASLSQITIDSYGRVTGIATYSISIPTGNLLSPYDKGWTANNVSSNGETASNSTITYTPVQGSYVSVFVNGQEIQVGNATTSTGCYFGTNSTAPKGFSASNAITSGDYLYWNPSVSGFNLETGFRISVHYLIPS